MLKDTLKAKPLYTLTVLTIVYLCDIRVPVRVIKGSNIV